MDPSRDPSDVVMAVVLVSSILRAVRRKLVLGLVADVKCRSAIGANASFSSVVVDSMMVGECCIRN